MINKVVLMGRLTADPELKKTSSGVSVISFTLAVERNYQVNGQRETDFINCVAWRTTAEFISRYFTKGKMLALVGNIQVRKWTTPNNETRYATEVIADEVSFCGDSKSETAPTDFPKFTTDQTEFEEMGDNEPLPF